MKWSRARPLKKTLNMALWPCRAQPNCEQPSLLQIQGWVSPYQKKSDLGPNSYPKKRARAQTSFFFFRKPFGALYWVCKTVTSFTKAPSRNLGGSSTQLHVSFSGSATLANSWATPFASRLQCSNEIETKSSHISSHAQTSYMILQHHKC